MIVTRTFVSAEAMDGHLNTRIFVDRASFTSALSALVRNCLESLLSNYQICMRNSISFRIAINTSDSFECFYVQSNYTFKQNLVFIPPHISCTSCTINTRKCYRTFLPFVCVFSSPRVRHFRIDQANFMFGEMVGRNLISIFFALTSA